MRPFIVSLVAISCLLALAAWANADHKSKSKHTVHTGMYAAPAYGGCNAAAGCSAAKATTTYSATVRTRSKSTATYSESGCAGAKRGFRPFKLFKGKKGCGG